MKKSNTGDYFKSGSPWFWALQVLINLYGLSLFAFWVLVSNATALDTYFHNWQGPGQYYSLRYVSLYWYILMLACAKVFMFPSLASLITYRHSRGCSIGWFVFVCILAFINLFTFVGLLTYYVSANQSGEIDNPANSPEWCCLENIYSVDSNECPNNGPCTPVVTSVHAQTDFIWYFYVTLAYVLADAFFVGFFSGLFGPTPLSIASSSSKKKQQQPPAAGPLEGSPGRAPQAAVVKMTKGV